MYFRPKVGIIYVLGALGKQWFLTAVQQGTMAWQEGLGRAQAQILEESEAQTDDIKH